MADAKAAQQTALELLEEDDEFEVRGDACLLHGVTRFFAQRCDASQEFAEAAAQAHVEGAEETQLWQVRCSVACWRFVSCSAFSVQQSGQKKQKC